jgi:type I site-specific restriction endonuclease
MKHLEAGYLFVILITPVAQRNVKIFYSGLTPDAILTSVGILTTGFDEPTVDTIILNRATKSLTLYQMIGRGSRKLPNKDMFTVIDLGNNAARFGLWSEPVTGNKSPEFYLENLRDDTEIELYFKYSMPLDLRAKFSKTAEVTLMSMKSTSLSLHKICVQK